MKLFILLMCFGLSVSAQKNELVQKNQQVKKKWLSLTGNDVFIYSCMAVSGAADGINQAIVHHNFGQGNKFWDISVSWKNKYKDWNGGDKSAAFLGSKNIFVAFTDAFHLSRLVDRGFTLSAVCFSASDLKQYRKKDRWKVIIKKAIVSTLINRLTFDALFDNLHGPI